jgi:large subunit ribosomal protein L10
LPNANVLKEKQELVAALAEKIKNSAAGVVVDYRGITVADDTKLRRELREAGVHYAVIKNNILRRAAEEAGLGELTAHMTGTTAFAYSEEDPIAAAKILNKYAEASKDKFEIRAGYMDGKALDKDGVVAVAKLPGKQELLTMLCMALNGNIRGLAVALNAIKEKKENEAA